MSRKRNKCKLRVLGISGSPRRGGNTDILLGCVLDGALSGGAHVDKIVLNDLRFLPCQGCGKCHISGSCIQKDDLAEIFKKVARSDRVVLASPIYFTSVTAQTKAFVDRFEWAWSKDPAALKNVEKVQKKGLFLCVAGERSDRYMKNARSVVKALFNVLKIKYAGGVYVNGVEGRGDILLYPSMLRRAYRAGVKLTK